MTGKQKGFFYAILGPVLWGISGSIAQYLFSAQHVDPAWLVGIRMLFAGVLLVLWSAITQPQRLWEVWKRPKWILQMFLFGTCGMLPAQFTYFIAIRYSNAPTVTVLQFLGPLFIIIYLALRWWRLPRRVDFLSIVVALLGTYLLVTQGHWNKLALAPIGVAWGLGSAVSQALYTLLPRQLLRQFDARVVTGWSMLIGGIMFIPAAHLQNVPPLNPTTLICIFFVVTGGTMFSYLFYLQSLQYLTATTTGMMSAFEPLTATFIAITIFQTHFGPVEILGGVLILATTFLQAMSPSQSFETVNAKSPHMLRFIKHHLVH